MKKTLTLILILLSFELYSQEIIKFTNAEFEFCLTKECDKNNCEITKIEILKNGISMQILKPKENYFFKSLPSEQLFILEDMNFDGKTDFRLLEFLPAGPNLPFLYWIYNPKSKVFEENTDFSDIISPEFNYQKKEIYSSWREGCCKRGNDTYQIKNDTPELIERFIVGNDLDGKEYFERWKNINGILKLIEKSEE